MDPLLYAGSGSDSESDSDSSSSSNSESHEIKAAKPKLSYDSIARAGYNHAQGLQETIQQIKRKEEEQKEEERHRLEDAAIAIAKADIEEQSANLKLTKKKEEESKEEKKDDDEEANADDRKRKWKPKHGMDSIIAKVGKTSKDMTEKEHLAIYESMMKKGMFRKAENFLNEMYQKN